MDVVARLICMALVLSALTGCGGGGHVTSPVDPSMGGTSKLSLGLPVQVGRDVTVTEWGFDVHQGRGVVIESIRPLHLAGAAVPLGAAILRPPHEGFETDQTGRFPHMSTGWRFARLPYAISKDNGTINFALGFDIRKPGFTKFSGVEMTFRKDGVHYVATMPLAVGLCGGTLPKGGSCAAPPPKATPEAGVRRL